jgi:hypothetical protein
MLIRFFTDNHNEVEVGSFSSVRLNGSSTWPPC